MCKLIYSPAVTYIYKHARKCGECFRYYSGVSTLYDVVLAYTRMHVNRQGVPTKSSPSVHSPDPHQAYPIMLTINSGHLATKPRRTRPAVRVHSKRPQLKASCSRTHQTGHAHAHVMFTAAAPHTKPVADLRFQLAMSSSSRPCTPSDYREGHADTRGIRQEIHKSWKGNRGSFRA